MEVYGRSTVGKVNGWFKIKKGVQRFVRGSAWGIAQGMNP